MKSNYVDELEDYRFLASCLQIGFRIEDLEKLKYTDVAKVMICIQKDSNKEQTRKATQTDIDKFLM